MRAVYAAGVPRPPCLALALVLAGAPATAPVTEGLR